MVEYGDEEREKNLAVDGRDIRIAYVMLITI